MPVTTANFAADLVGSAFPALSATVGALGAFIAFEHSFKHDVQPVPIEVAQTLSISSAVVVALGKPLVLQQVT
ncbi:hypothetical protein O9992_22315 [Vibrio lentus]|nr:hypothetical protein [Vibrio lentus]